jgi:hypothetical protein
MIDTGTTQSFTMNLIEFGVTGGLSAIYSIMVLRNCSMCKIFIIILGNLTFAVSNSRHPDKKKPLPTNYGTRDSRIVTDRSTGLAISCLTKAEWTRCIEFSLTVAENELADTHIYIQLWTCVIGGLNLLHMIDEAIRSFKSSVLWNTYSLALLLRRRDRYTVCC